jgi:BirA family biotin operon repressor/biotin-[acetyl-CoA-carboxylase] ligase
VAGVEAQLKWPNDLLAGGRKLAGILAEVLPAASAVAGAPAALVVVVGLGLNVAWPPPDDTADDAADNALNDDVLYMATSLWRESATRFGPGALVDPLLDDLERRLRDLDDRPGRQRLASEYRRRCLTLGRTVRVSVSDGSFTGVATDITPEGHLVVDVGACFKTVAAGDVVHLRDGA